LVDEPDDPKNPLRARPKFTPGVAFYYKAFVDLSTDRPSSMGGLMPIPWSSIDRYAIRHKIEGEYFDELVLMVRAADAEVLRIHNTKSEKNDGQ